MENSRKSFYEKKAKKAVSASFILSIVGCVFLVLILGVVYLRLQQTNHDLGERLRASELELRNIQETNSVLMQELSLLKTPENMLQRAEAMGLNLRQTTITQIIRLPEVELPEESVEEDGN